MGNIFSKKYGDYDLRGDDFSCLKGVTVLRVLGNPKGDFLTFETNQGNFGFEAHGDCCSSSWFEHFTGVDFIVGATVTDVRRIDITEVVEKPKYGEIQQYGYQLVTDKGFVDIEMRNESNGYYGGSVDGRTADMSLPVLKEDF